MARSTGSMASPTSTSASSPPTSSWRQSKTIDLDLSIRVSLGTGSSPVNVYYGAGILFIGGGESCNIWLEPLDIAVEGAVSLQLDTNAAGLAYLDASIPLLDYELGIQDNSFNNSGCILGEIIEIVDDVFRSSASTAASWA